MMLFIMILSIKLFKDKLLKETILWCFVSILFFISHQISAPDIFSNYKVTHIKPYKIHIKNGINTYEVKGKHDYRLSDRVKVNHVYKYESPSQYQKSRRIKGYASLDDMTFIRRPISLKRYFHESMPEMMQDFFDKSIDTIFSVLSLQLMGLIEILRFILRKFITEDKFSILEKIVIIIYAYLFGFSFGVMRILFKSVFKKREVYIPLLLIFYPHSFYDVSFNLVYLPFMLQNLSSYFSNVNFFILRSFFLMRLFGKLQILEMIFYPVVKVYSGFILLMSLLGLHSISLFLLEKGMFLLDQKRLLLVGAPSILWLGCFLFYDRKKQLISFMLMLCFMCYYPFTRVVMINVYQGDATLITLPFNAISVLIDTGRAASYQTLRNSLHRHGIKKLDYLVITHADLDHCENRDDILIDYDVSYLIESKNQSVPYMTQLLKDKDYGDDNEDSLIFYFNTSKASFLFMGDATEIQEKDIVKENPYLKVDVLKLGHHGSKTSTTQEFLESVRPKLALISSDPRIYNHPHPEVMKNLQSYHIPSLQSSIEGDVTIKLLPFLNIIVSKEGGFGIMR